MAGGFIPHQDGAFLERAKTLLAYVSPKLTAFNIPAAAFPPIQAQLTACETAFETAQSPNRGKVEVLNKNETKEALTGSLCAFIKAYLAYNPAVLDADKENMGLPLHAGARTPAPVPTTIPELELDGSVIRQALTPSNSIKPIAARLYTSNGITSRVIALRYDKNQLGDYRE